MESGDRNDRRRLEGKESNKKALSTGACSERLRVPRFQAPTASQETVSCDFALAEEKHGERTRRKRSDDLEQEASAAAAARKRRGEQSPSREPALASFLCSVQQPQMLARPNYPSKPAIAIAKRVPRKREGALCKEAPKNKRKSTESEIESGATERARKKQESSLSLLSLHSPFEFNDERRFHLLLLGPAGLCRAHGRVQARRRLLRFCE